MENVMKLSVTTLALTLVLGLAVGPVAAQNVDMSSLTPTLTYPTPDPEPVVTKNDLGPRK